MHLDGLGAVLGSQYPETLGAKKLLHQSQLPDLVLDEKNRRAAARHLFPLLFRRPLTDSHHCRFFARHRQIDIKSCTAASLTGQIDEAAVAGDNTVNHREPEAAPLALRLGRKKRLEDATPDGFIDAVSGIRHPDIDVLFLARFLEISAKLAPGYDS